MLRPRCTRGEFADPASEEFLVRALADRRDAIGRAYLTAINPISDPMLDDTGRLTFTNPAVDGDFAKAPRGYARSGRRSTTRRGRPRSSVRRLTQRQA
jgi:hypothetical protein